MPGAWTSPITWTPGQIVTDANLNSALRDNLLWLGNTDGLITQNAQYHAVQNNTTTSATAVSLPGAVTPAITTVSGSIVLVSYSVSVSNSAAGNVITLYLQVDAGGYTIALAICTSPAANYIETLGGSVIISGLGIASHTFSLGWSTSAGTATQNNTVFTTLTAIEIRR